MFETGGNISCYPCHCYYDLPLNSPTQLMSLWLITYHKPFNFSFYTLTSGSKNSEFHDCTESVRMCGTTVTGGSFPVVNPTALFLFDFIVATWMCAL